MRDLALLQSLGGAGLRSGEARRLPVSPFDQGHADNQGGSVYLRVHDQGKQAVAPCRSGATSSTRSSSSNASVRTSPNSPRTHPVPTTRTWTRECQLPRRWRAALHRGGRRDHPPDHARPWRSRSRRTLTLCGTPSDGPTWPAAVLSSRVCSRSWGTPHRNTTSRYVHHNVEVLGRVHLRLEREVRYPLTRHQQHRVDRAARQR